MSSKTKSNSESSTRTRKAKPAPKTPTMTRGEKQDLRELLGVSSVAEARKLLKIPRKVKAETVYMDIAAMFSPASATQASALQSFIDGTNPTFEFVVEDGSSFAEFQIELNYTLTQLGPLVSKLGWLTLSWNNRKNYSTVTPYNIYDIKSTIASATSQECTSTVAGRSKGGNASVSDVQEIKEIFRGGSVTFERPQARVGANWTRPSGAFFPFTHNMKDRSLSETLERLGCWSSVDPENYRNNCLYNALQSSGVDPQILEAFQAIVRTRKVSVKNLRVFANDHNLRIVCDRDESTAHAITCGPKDGFPVHLAIIDGHYIHLYDTKFNKYALRHYDELISNPKLRSPWWTYKSPGKTDSKRGMNSLNLLRTLKELKLLTPIDASTHNIFKTQFYDKFSSNEFRTLEYPLQYAQPFHDIRDGVGTIEAEDPCKPQSTSSKIQELTQLILEGGGEDGEGQQIMEKLSLQILNDQMGAEDQVKLLRQHLPNYAKLEERIRNMHLRIQSMHGGDKILKRLAEKFKRTNMGLREQVKMLTKYTPAVAHYFFDFEASPYGEHKPYCVNFWKLSDEGAKEEKHSFTARDDEECGKLFLEHINEKHGELKKSTDAGFDPPTVKILAHNISYDLSFLWKHLARFNTCEKTPGNVVSGTGYYYTFGSEIAKKKNPDAKPDDKPKFTPDLVVRLSFQDTYKMIPMPLKDFGDAFDLDQGKEVMPYELYTKEFLDRDCMATLSELNACTLTKDDRNVMMTNLTKWGCIDSRNPLAIRYDMMRYANEYCRVDVEVLAKGWTIFRDGLLDRFGIDVFAYPTMASLADSYFSEYGCFEGVCKIAGVPQRFIKQCTIGGRVMCRSNKPSITYQPRQNNKKIKRYKRQIKGEADGSKLLDDFDGVSLYPSAMRRINGGYLKGSPKVWDSSVNIHSVDGYFLKIKVTKVGKKFSFPITRLKNPEGGNYWTNELVGEEIFVDKFTLEDLVKHSQVEYEIREGYYFNEGRNPKINEAIQELFDLRREYKKAESPLQLVIKLMMNTGYGICGLNPIETDITYIDEDDKVNFIANHSNDLKILTHMPNNQWRAECYKQIDTHFNRQHIACEVLSVSKQIMNEVMCLAEDLGLYIHYTDTDSMHIDSDGVDVLKKAFKEKYDRELVGEELGQFHCDFSFSKCHHLVEEDGVKRLEEVDDSVAKIKGDKPKARRSIFLGKKSYIDEIVDGAGNVAYHIRLKGIPLKCILDKMLTDFNGEPMKFYEHLSAGKPIHFMLNGGGQCCFRTGKDHIVRTLAVTPTRTVHFPLA